MANVTQTASIDLKSAKAANEAAAKTATNYISADSTGIRIANADPATATTYQHQTATETEFVVGGHVKMGLSDDGGLVVCDNSGNVIGRLYASDASGSEGNIGAFLLGVDGNNQNTWAGPSTQYSPRMLVGSDLKAVGSNSQVVFGQGNKPRTDALLIVGASGGVPGFIPDSSRYNALVVLQDGTVLLDTSRIANVENETHVINMNYNIDLPNMVLATGTSSGTTTAEFRPLVANDIPSLPASKISSGTFASARIPTLSPTKSGFQAGTIAISSVNSASGADSAITFTPSFSSAPIVIVGMTSNQTALTGACSAYAMNVSTTGFTLRRQNNSTSARNIGAYWMAFEI